MRNHPQAITPVVALGILLATGCGEESTSPPDTPPPPPTPTPAALVVVSGNDQSGAVGAPLPADLVVRVTDADGRGVEGVSVTFDASDGAGSFSPSTASTDPSGDARTQWTLGTTPGLQEASARLGSVDPVPLRATAEPGPVAVVEASRAAVMLAALGDTAHIAATAADAYGNGIPDPDFTWSSLDTVVAKVDDAGVVTAVGGGSTEVVAAAGGAADTVGISVMQTPARLTLTASASLVNAIGDTIQLTTEVWDANDQPVPGAAVAFRSTDTSVLTVDADGRVVAQGVGVARAIGEIDQLADTVEIEVRQVVAAVTLGIAPGAILFDETLQLSALAVDSNGVPVPSSALTWSSSDEAIATVDADGLLTGVGLGLVQIQAAAGAAQDLLQIRIMPDPVTAVVAGRRHTCFIDLNGVAYCWGDNTDGQLGIGNAPKIATPTAVSTGQRFVRLAAGRDHTCGLTVLRAVYCWGDNQSGQLGSGGGDARTPVPMTTTLEFERLAAGNGHTCALTGTGDAYCWGNNLDGQLGGGATGGSGSEPTEVVGDHTFRVLAAAGNHTCALTLDGSAYCWGNNTSGQIGDGSAGTDRPAPELVIGGRTFGAIAAGSAHTCAVATNGTAYCWGSNGSGQLGDGTTNPSTAPTAVAGPSGFTHLVAGGNTTCGAVDNVPYCWGANRYGQAGVAGGDQSSPARVSGGLLARVLVLGEEHACATTTGAVRCWGNRAYLGDGSPVYRAAPVAVLGGRTYTEIEAGATHTCALAATGTTYCWGDGGSGQLGNGALLSSGSPVAVSGGPYHGIAAASQHTCALNGAGDGYCWGANISGSLGTATPESRSVPGLVVGGFTFDRIHGGSSHSCALRASNGAAYCWGGNWNGMIGTGSTTPLEIYQPVAVTGGRAYTRMSVGFNHTCALTSGGAAYCWGENFNGQLGNGSTGTISATPVLVQGGVEFSEISAGDSHTCALTSAGDAYCWGNNASGQLGDGSLTTRSTPVAVSAGGVTFASIHAGGSHTCARTTADVAYCWGENADGQLGTGTTVQRRLPGIVTGGHTFNHLTAGRDHTCGIDAAGRAHCWGRIGFGKLGNGISLAVTASVAVDQPPGVVVPW